MPLDISRKLVVQGLMKVEQSGFSNLVLLHILKDETLSQQDKAFISKIFYGTIERRYTLDFVLSVYINRPLEKLDGRVRAIMQSALYQIFYMDSVPDFAAVNRAVGLCSAFKKTSAKSFVNAVLRKCRKFDISKARFKSEEERLSVLYSVSPPIVRILMRDYKEKREDILSGLFSPAPLTVRINTLKITPRRYRALLDEKGIEYNLTRLEECVQINNSGRVEQLPGYGEGYFFVQGITSSMAVKAAEIRQDDTVLDLCAAPGGKSFSAAMYLDNTGRLISCDPNPSRIKLIEDGAARLRITNIETYQNFGQNYRPDFGMRHRVICDVPCSGIGIIAKKPDIRFKDLKDIDRLCWLQYSILSTAARYVVPGGKLVYSTCTLNKDENEAQIRRFLDENKDFSLVNTDISGDDITNDDNMITFLPLNGRYDGFFIAVLEKVW